MKITLDKEEYSSLMKEKLFQCFGQALGAGNVGDMEIELGSSYSRDYCTIGLKAKKEEGEE